MDNGSGNGLDEDTDPVRIELRELVEAGAQITSLLAYGCTPEQVIGVLADLAAVPRGYFFELVIDELQRE